MGRPRKPRKIHNLAQQILLDSKLTGKEISELVEIHPVQVSRHLCGDAVPELPARQKYAAVFGLDADAWLTRPVYVPARRGSGIKLAEFERFEPTPELERVRKERGSLATVGEAAGSLLKNPTATSAEKLTAAVVELRRWKERLADAINALSPILRILARADFDGVRVELAGALGAWPHTAARVAALIALPAEGPHRELEVCREGIEGLMRLLDQEGQRALHVEGFSKASQFDQKRNQARGMLEAASLNDDPVKLLKLDAWKGLTGQIGDVLRACPGALEAVQIGFGDESPFGRDLLANVAHVRHITFPARQFQVDPVAFVRTILGEDPTEQQTEILLSWRDNKRTAVKSGRRTGKTDAIAMCMAWAYGSFDDARVFFTAPTDRQINSVVWSAYKRYHRRSGLCLACRKREAREQEVDKSFRIARPCVHSAVLDGEVAEKAKTGVHSSDGREVSGFTAKDAESTQGLAGKALFLIADEASGVDDPIFEALEGNLSGGGRLLLSGNPTRNEGEHYEAFYKKKKFYHQITLSSEQTPNVLSGQNLVPGLATREWIAQMEEMHGRESAFFKIHVLGEHAIGEDGRLISAYQIAQAEERWYTLEDEGELVIGVDPAGAGGEGDESTIVARRGKKVLMIAVRRGLDDDGHLREVLELVQRYRIEREIVHCNVDTEGLGVGTFARLQAYAATQPLVLRVHSIKSHAKAVRQPHVYDTMRDEMAANFVQWLKEGGAIPTDIKLEAELHSLEMRTTVTAKGERTKLIPKKEIRKLLKRSPDRYDGVALACWESSTMHEQIALPPPRDERRPVIDPYAGMGGNSAGEIDPYG